MYLGNSSLVAKFSQCAGPVNRSYGLYIYKCMILLIIRVGCNFPNGI